MSGALDENDLNVGQILYDCEPLNWNGDDDLENAALDDVIWRHVVVERTQYAGDAVNPCHPIATHKLLVRLTGAYTKKSCDAVTASEPWPSLKRTKHEAIHAALAELKDYIALDQRRLRMLNRILGGMKPSTTGGTNDGDDRV